MRSAFYDLINDLVHYGKSEKKFFDCRDDWDFPNLYERGLVQDFETVGSA